MTTPNPTNALTPQVMLATAMHAQPGVYAALLGSGVSTGAGIPTGWGVVQELVRRVAVASAPEDPEQLQEAERDAESWWKSHDDGPLGYSNLLEKLAPTPATRQGILAGFFEPTDEDRAEGVKVPSKAHLALAELVKRGYVKVVITTNFDRLMEQALEAVGVSPQIIARPEAVNGMSPLAHATATVIKLHGDYLDLGSRNTPDELQSYPAEWNKVLDQIFDEYGIIISGWSADWDEALVSAIERAPSRRYPLYWDSRSSKGEPAKRLLQLRFGNVIQAASADDLFRDLLASVDALERLSEPPLTTAMAIAQLKRYLPNPIHRIDLHNLVISATDHTAEFVENQPIGIPDFNWEKLQEIYHNYLVATEPLLHLLRAGIKYDNDGTHADLWLEVLQRLLSARKSPDGSFNELLDAAQHYPALLALYTMGLVSVSRRSDRILPRLLTEPEWYNRFEPNEPYLAAEALHLQRVLHDDSVNQLPRWEGTKWLFPAGKMLREDLREFMAESFASARDYSIAFSNLEYEVGLVQELGSSKPGRYHAASGEFVLESNWINYEDPTLRSEMSFRKIAENAPDDWLWWEIIGGRDRMEEVLQSYRERLRRYRRFG